jgi:hypothetical protein
MRAEVLLSLHSYWHHLPPAAWYVSDMIAGASKSAGSCIWYAARLVSSVVIVRHSSENAA